MKSAYSFLAFCLLLLCACNSNDDPIVDPEPMEPEPEPMELGFVRGADLSYVNEMEDCGAKYYDEAGQEQDPFSIFADAGTNLVRVRLWHNPEWTEYSDFADVKKTISRAKSSNMKVLLDFHYSDDWADPGKQVVPAAWLPVVNNTNVLGDSVYNYTSSVLTQLGDDDLLPDFVQVGNEINSEILQDPNQSYNLINWTRNVALLKRGLQAVKDVAESFDTPIETMLHVAQPENAVWWFEESTANGLTEYDWIGLSYYPLWSDVSMDELPASIQALIDKYNKGVMIVETAYPFTLNNNDPANNILNQDAALPGIPISEQGQLDYLNLLEEKIAEGGGEGLIYWEPAWVSTSCNTQWGQGSHWDNATLFDHSNKANLGMQYYQGN